MPHKEAARKYERCILGVKAKQSKYNPWAVCAKLRPKGYKPGSIKLAPLAKRKIYTGPRGGRFYLIGKRKVYIKSQ